MDLRQQRVTSFWQPVDIVEAFDDVHFPKRAVHIQRPRVVARHVNAELAPVTRLRQPAVPDVVLEVEMLVIDPVREIQFHRHVHQPPFEQRAHVQPALDVREDVLEPYDLPARHGRLVVDRNRREMGQVVRGLQVKELGVLWA